MGAAESYLAIKGKAKEEIWKALSLKKSANQDPSSMVDLDELIIGVPLKSGWYQILDYSDTLVDNKNKMSRLSTGAEVLVGSVEEHVMYCMAACWHNGKIAWSIEHNSDRGPEHLQVTGTPPKSFEAIKKRIKQEREATPENERHDFFFSIPVDLYEELTGYSYCKMNGASDRKDFEYLEKA